MAFLGNFDTHCALFLLYGFYDYQWKNAYMWIDRKAHLLLYCVYITYKGHLRNINFLHCTCIVVYCNRLLLKINLDCMRLRVLNVSKVQLEILRQYCFIMHVNTVFPPNYGMPFLRDLQTCFCLEPVCSSFHFLYLNTFIWSSFDF